jgi:hypothetical protein
VCRADWVNVAGGRQKVPAVRRKVEEVADWNGEPGGGSKFQKRTSKVEGGREEGI